MSIRRRVFLVRNGCAVAVDTTPLKGNDPEAWVMRFDGVPSQVPFKPKPEPFAKAMYEDIREQSLRPFAATTPMRPWDELPKTTRDAYVHAASVALKRWYGEAEGRIDTFEVHVLVEEEP